LSANAAESRRRTESLYYGETVSEPLALTVLISGDQLKTNSCVHVLQSPAGTRQVNGNCDIADDHMTVVSSQTDRVSDTLNLPNNHGIMSDSSKSVSRNSGSVARRDGGYEVPLTGSPFEQLSNGASMPNGVVASQDSGLMFIAAGHEVTMMGLQKQYKDKGKGPRQQTHPNSNSTIIPPALADGCSSDDASVPSRRGPQTRGLNCVTDEWSLQSGVDSGSGRGNGGPRQTRRRSSNSTAVPAGGTCLSGSQGTSSSASVQSDSDVISTPADLSPSLSIDDCDIIAPTYASLAASPNLSAVGQRDIVSPGRSDHSDGDTIGDAVQPQRFNCIGRGQVLRMMLNGNQ